MVLGAAETVVGLTDVFKPFPDRRGLYRRTGGAGENSGGWRDRDEGRCDGGALTNVR
jgi:hypothetical protein